MTQHLSRRVQRRILLIGFTCGILLAGLVLAETGTDPEADREAIAWHENVITD